MKSRPLGVTIFGALFILLNSLEVFELVEPYIWAVVDPARNKIVGGGLLSIPLIFGLAGIVAGIGILRLRSKARLLTLALALGWMLYWGRLGVEDAMRPPGSETGVMASIACVAIAWNCLVLWYFLRPGVKAQFKRAHST